MLTWIFGQLLSYGLLAWAGFVAVTVLSSLIGGGPGVIVGHFLVAAVVFALDVRWVLSATASPTYDPNVGPDFDGLFLIVFPAGVLVRAVAINVALLPVACATLRLRQRIIRREADAGPTEGVGASRMGGK